MATHSTSSPSLACVAYGYGLYLWVISHTLCPFNGLSNTIQHPVVTMALAIIINTVPCRHLNSYLVKTLAIEINKIKLQATVRKLPCCASGFIQLLIQQCGIRHHRRLENRSSTADNTNPLSTSHQGSDAGSYPVHAWASCPMIYHDGVDQFCPQKDFAPSGRPRSIFPVWTSWPGCHPWMI